jgi:hypothetical protein
MSGILEPVILGWTSDPWDMGHGQGRTVYCSPRDASSKKNVRRHIGEGRINIPSTIIYRVVR